MSELPKWESDDPEEQKAFLQWALDQLEALEPFSSSSLKEPPSREEVASKLTDWFAPHVRRNNFVRARQLMPRLKWATFLRDGGGPNPRSRETRGRKRRAYYAAVDDDQKLRWLFQSFYGKSNRYHYPQRADILKERHKDLTAEDLAKLSAKLKWNEREDRKTRRQR